MSAAEREPPGCPLPAVAIMLMTWRRNCFAIFSRSGVDKSNLAPVRRSAMVVNLSWISNYRLVRYTLSIWIGGLCHCEKRQRRSSPFFFFCHREERERRGDLSKRQTLVANRRLPRLRLAMTTLSVIARSASDVAISMEADVGAVQRLPRFARNDRG